MVSVTYHKKSQKITKYSKGTMSYDLIFTINFNIELKYKVFSGLKECSDFTKNTKPEGYRIIPIGVTV